MIPVLVASGNGAAALPEGMRVLARGGSALDAVEACARVVEADPADRTVGLGGHPNVVGEVELDASIVDGTTRRVGSVAALKGFLHPITVARAVMERLPHVLLVGDGAARFAREIGAETAELLTPETRRLWLERLGEIGTTEAWVARERALAPIVWKAAIEELGTVNFLGVARKGRFASAVTTSGWAYKYPGRVGDSPIAGAGNYCDSRHGAAACTGFGELAMRALTAKTAVDRLADGWTAARVARAAIRDVNALESPGTRMNIVVLAKDGTHAAASARADVRYAFMTAAMDAPLTKPRAFVARAGRGT